MSGFSKILTLATVLLGMAGTAVQAGDYGYGYHAPSCRYEVVVTWQHRTEKFVTWTVEYDDYGCAHKVPHVGYRTVKFPVKQLVKVCD